MAEITKKAPFREIRDAIGSIGTGLMIVWCLSLAGSLLTIFVGAPLWPIPLIGLLGLLLLPFPTLAIYVSAIFVIYLIFYVLPLGKWRGAIGLLCALALVAMAAVAYPRNANRAFDGQIGQYKQRGAWLPANLPEGSNVTLVRSEHTGIDADCDSFCFGLLLSNRAKHVTIMTSPAFDRPESLKISGKGYRLDESSDSCIANLPPMNSPNLPFPDDIEAQQRTLRDHFETGVLNKAFEDDLKNCIATNDVVNEPLNGWVFVDWRSEFDPESYDQPTPKLNARVAIVNVQRSQPVVVERFDIYGARVATPAWIWPYGGNAGSGGTFSPTLAREHVEWDVPEPSFDGWWRFVAQREQIVESAIARVQKERRSAKAQSLK